MANLRISWEGPVYYSQGDEDRFFACIYTLPEYVTVTGRLRTEILELRLPIARETFRELIALFTRYEISLLSLRPALANLSKKDLAYFTARAAPVFTSWRRTAGPTRISWSGPSTCATPSTTTVSSPSRTR